MTPDRHQAPELQPLAGYMVVRSVGHLAALEIIVNKRIGEGWQVQGAPFRDDRTEQWCQAMTRTSSKTNIKEPRR